MEYELETFKNLIRSKLYDYTAKLSYLSYDDEWIRDKIQHLSEVIQRAIETSENLIVLVRGQPSSGKTYLVRKALSNVLLASKKSKDQSTHVIELYAYDHVDDIKCMRELLNRLELVAGSNRTAEKHMLVSNIRSRILHCLKILKRSNRYIIIVIDGFEIFTKGNYDCSSTVGSVSRRQGLLYFLSDSMQIKGTAFSIVFVTSDLNCIDRMEKRVKSRFVYEPVYCFSDYDVTEYFDSVGESKKILPNCIVKADKDKMSMMIQDSVCGKDRNHISIDACISILMLKKFEFKIKREKNKSLVHVTMRKELKKDRVIFQNLSIPQHLILVSLSRLHVKGVYPQTLLEIIKDLQDMVAFFPAERNSLPNPIGLRRVFLELVYMGLIEWVNYSENKIDNVKVQHLVNDPSGNTIPCRFPKYRE
uniref:Archaeal ATPase/NACHT domain containing protein, putative n=1 Tax=Theileria annulata TaxID=5874 RepID=A0A3B0MNJ4_THEAN